MPNVCLAYKPYVGIRTKFLSVLKNNVLPRRTPARMPPCLKRIQPMPNVPLAYVSVYQRMSDIFHTLAYASTIRYSVTGPLYRTLIADILYTCIHKTSFLLRQIQLMTVCCQTENSENAFILSSKRVIFKPPPEFYSYKSRIIWGNIWLIIIKWQVGPTSCPTHFFRSSMLCMPFY